MTDIQPDDGFNKERAGLFEALGHPLRLEILRVLSEAPLGFADLKRRVNVTSSGHLAHHLEKLDGLIETTPDGLYGLTDDGREALRVVAVPKGFDKPSDNRKILLSRTLLVGLVIAMLLLALVALIQELEVMDLTNKVPSENRPLPTSNLNSSALQVITTPLTPVVSQSQNVTIAVEVFNPSDYGLQTTGHPRGTSLNPCSKLSPVNVEIYLGCYTSDNISEGPPLFLVPGFGCPNLLINIVNYTFYPHSDIAISSVGSSSTTAEIRGIFAMSGYYAWVKESSSSAYILRFQPFAPGTYTVQGSDIWGDTALAYFTVQ